MRTYVADASVAEAWQDYQVGMRGLYYFFKVEATPEQSRRIILSDYLPPLFGPDALCTKQDDPCLGIDVEQLAQFYIPPRGINPSLDQAMRTLLQEFRLENEALIDRVLESDVRI
jgi:hypothetical protein